jgi:TolB-like protein
MSDVFISYARSTASHAQAVAEALRALGYSVWWDDELPSHRAYGDVIEEQLRSARAVVVIWSAEAVKSQWVRSEADRAREGDKLVQLSVDNTRLPMPFDQIQCADLAAWSGDLEAPGWRKVLASLADLIQLAPSPPAAGEARAPRAADQPVLAVLAFDNLSNDPDLAYFSDGVSAEIQQTVGRTAELKVIARASSFQFRGADKAVRHVASALNATHILDGSVRRSGARVRIATELIACADETSLWSERFDRDLSDVFALQDEIAAAVAQALKIAFAPAPKAGSIDPAAYDLYLRASDRSIDTSVSDRIGMFEQVTALAPNYAPGWAWLAYYRSRGFDPSTAGDVGLPITRPGAKEAAARALSLDPRSSVAFTALAWLEPYAQYAKREALLRKAVDAAPNDPHALATLGHLLDQVGRTKEAAAWAAKAHELAPLDSVAAASVATVAVREGRYEEGQRLYDEFRERWPGWGFVVPSLAWAVYAGDWARFDSLSNRAEAAGYTAMEATRRVIELGRAVREKDAGHLALRLASLEANLAETGAPRLDWLTTVVLLGGKEQAFSVIERASYATLFEEGSANPGGAYTAAIMFDQVVNAEMMRDVRFVGLCAKMGLCDYWIETAQWPDCAALVDYDFRAECRRLAHTTTAAS